MIQQAEKLLYIQTKAMRKGIQSGEIKMPQGGKRPGAGRPLGAATKRTREIADKAAAEGLLPLDVMLRAMREHATAERWDEAAAIAKDAAPYLHPRLSAIAHAGADDGPMQVTVQWLSSTDGLQLQD